MIASIRRALTIGGVVLLFVVLVGATYQGVVTALERYQFPRPGKLLTIGDHQLHIDCRGRGTPTVVLEAPATAMSSAWGWVQTSVARTTRVCSYDRAGLGWSESGDAPFTPQAVPVQLHALLASAGEKPPFVMAGADLGAAFATIYSAQYPDDVGALVVVNPPGPFNPRVASPSVRFLALSPWLARVGILRATRSLSSGASELPSPSGGAMRAFLNRPDHLTRAAAEMARWDDIVAMSDAATLRQSLPVTQVEVEGQDRIAELSEPRNAQDVTNAIVRAVITARVSRER
jgi:pimeloyl-ACP methyl ester carboxylesterase